MHHKQFFSIDYNVKTLTFKTEQSISILPNIYKLYNYMNIFTAVIAQKDGQMMKQTKIFLSYTLA